MSAPVRFVQVAVSTSHEDNTERLAIDDRGRCWRLTDHTISLERDDYGCTIKWGTEWRWELIPGPPEPCAQELRLCPRCDEEFLVEPTDFAHLCPDCAARPAEEEKKP